MLQVRRSEGWVEDAACAGNGWESFFDAPDPVPALQTCKRCPVRMPCLRFAVRSRIDWGIWGGLTPEDRRRLHPGQLLY